MGTKELCYTSSELSGTAYLVLRPGSAMRWGEWEAALHGLTVFTDLTDVDLLEFAFDIEEAEDVGVVGVGCLRATYS